MLLAHGRRKPLLKAAEQLAKAAVAVTIGMNGAIFLPRDEQRDAGLLQFQRQFRPVRLGKPAHALLHPNSGEQPVLNGVVGHLGRQRPA